MRVLLTNDDGIHGRGLTVLEEISRQFSDDIWVVAPETDQSGLSHSLTLNEPLRLRRVANQKFALKGTPADCVIMAARELMPKLPDLILSGVNAGANIGDDVTYSGTVAGAMEGALIGVKSIAVSQACDWDERHNIPWNTALHHAPVLIRKLANANFPARTLLNVNFPNCQPQEVAGMEITQQGSFIHSLSMEKRYDGRGFPYYWVRFPPQPRKTKEIDSDILTLSQNKISISPLKLDLTNHEFMAALQNVI